MHTTSRTNSENRRTWLYPSLWLVLAIAFTALAAIIIILLCRTSIIGSKQILMPVVITVTDHDSRPISMQSIICIRRVDSHSISTVREQLLTNKDGVAFTQAIVMTDRRDTLVGSKTYYAPNAIDVLAVIDGHDEPVTLELTSPKIKDGVYHVLAKIAVPAKTPE